MVRLARLYKTSFYCGDKVLKHIGNTQITPRDGAFFGTKPATPSLVKIIRKLRINVPTISSDNGSLDKNKVYFDYLINTIWEKKQRRHKILKEIEGNTIMEATTIEENQVE